MGKYGRPRGLGFRALNVPHCGEVKEIGGESGTEREISAEVRLGVMLALGSRVKMNVKAEIQVTEILGDLWQEDDRMFRRHQPRRFSTILVRFLKLVWLEAHWRDEERIVADIWPPTLLAYDVAHLVTLS